MESRIKYLEGTLKLKVNRKKSKTDTANKTKFLGFSLYQIAGRVGIRVHEKTQERLKERLKAMTGRSRRGSIASIFGELTKVLQGWMQYYRIADMKKYLTNLSEWLRRRIWQLHWKRWKRIQTRLTNLIALGVPKGSKAWEWANSRKGYWCISGSWILTTTMNNRYLETLGFPNILKKIWGITRKSQATRNNAWMLF